MPLKLTEPKDSTMTGTPSKITAKDILAVRKIFDDAPVPTKDRMKYDPETDSVVLIEDKPCH